MRNNLFIIAKSGWSYIGYALLAFVIFSILDLDLLAFASFLLTVFFIYVFRNPEKELPFFQPNSVVAPVDGFVIAIQQLENSEYAYKIDIESSYFNIGVLRFPMDAKVETVSVVKGSRVAKNSKLSPLLNEFAELVFVDNAENKVKVLHRLKQSFAPIDIDLVKNQGLLQRARYGTMVNGMTSIYLKSNFRVNVSVGQQTSASETLIGYFS